MLRGHDDRPCLVCRTGAEYRPGCRGGRVSLGRRSGARRGMGRPSFRPGRVALDPGPGGRSRHRRPARLARCPIDFSDNVPALEAFGDAIVDAGFTTAVVAGMGGSSLAPDVLHRTFGTSEGYLDLRVLDSTDPPSRPSSTTSISGRSSSSRASRARRSNRTRSRRPPGSASSRRSIASRITLTTSPAMPSWPSPIRARAPRPSAITTSLREVFLNPPDVGGRYSALTYVGLVPASLIGLDLDALLASANAMLGACREPDPDANPGVSLGSPSGRSPATAGTS